MESQHERAVEYHAERLRSGGVARVEPAVRRCTQVRRVLAIAMVLEGRSRTEAAELNGMDRQTLRDWVHRYNALVLAGSDPDVHGVVRWRCVDLRAEVSRCFGVEVYENTIEI
jgi:transposase-like protein